MKTDQDTVVVPSNTEVILHTLVFAIFNPLRVMFVLHLIFVYYPLLGVANAMSFVADKFDALARYDARLHVRLVDKCPIYKTKLSQALITRIQYSGKKL